MGKLFEAEVLVPWFNHARHLFRAPVGEKNDEHVRTNTRRGKPDARGKTSGPFHVDSVQARFPPRQRFEAKDGK